jgi:hypothetical protein
MNEKKIIYMSPDELRIEVAMLRERCAQLEIQLSEKQTPVYSPTTPLQPNPIWAPPCTPTCGTGEKP